MKSAYARNLKRQYSDVYAVHIYIEDRSCIPDTGRFTMTPEGRDFKRTSEFFTYI